VGEGLKTEQMTMKKGESKTTGISSPVLPGFWGASENPYPKLELEL
jgi:hypothetical protein